MATVTTKRIIRTRLWIGAWFFFVLIACSEGGAPLSSSSTTVPAQNSSRRVDAYAFSSIAFSDRAANLGSEANGGEPFTFLIAKSPSPAFLTCMADLRAKDPRIQQHHSAAGMIFNLPLAIDPYNLGCANASEGVIVEAGKVSFSAQDFATNLNFRHFLLPENIQKDIIGGSVYLLVSSSADKDKFPDRSFSPSLLPAGQVTREIGGVHFIIKSTIQSRMHGAKIDLHLFKVLADGRLEKFRLLGSGLPTELPAYVYQIDQFHLISKNYSHLPNCRLENAERLWIATAQNSIYFLPPNSPYNPFDLEFICNEYPARFASRFAIPMLRGNLATRSGPPATLAIDLQNLTAIPDEAFVQSIGNLRDLFAFAELHPTCCTTQGPMLLSLMPRIDTRTQTPLPGFFLHNLVNYLSYFRIAKIHLFHQQEAHELFRIPNLLQFVAEIRPAPPESSALHQTGSASSQPIDLVHAP